MERRWRARTALDRAAWEAVIATKAAVRGSKEESERRKQGDWLKRDWARSQSQKSMTYVCGQTRAIGLRRHLMHRLAVCIYERIDSGIAAQHSICRQQHTGPEQRTGIGKFTSLRFSATPAGKSSSTRFLTKRQLRRLVKP